MPPPLNPDKKEKINNLAWLKEITIKVDNPKQEAKEKFNEELTKNIREEHAEMGKCLYCKSLDTTFISQALMPGKSSHDILIYKCNTCMKEYKGIFLVKHFQ